MKSFGVSPPADDRTEWDGVSTKKSTDLVSLSQWKSLRNAVVALLAGIPSTLLEVGLPTGGAAGQALIKTSSTDGAVGWVTVSGSGAVSSVAGRTGAVTLSKSDVSLGSVDNTADTAKPVSTAQQTALDGKAPLARALPTGGTLGQLLAKNTATSYDVAWITPTAGAIEADSSRPNVTLLRVAEGAGNGTGGGTVSDASTSAKGVVQLAGDLAGTAASPTVPGLSGKANTSHSHAASDVTLGTIASARLGSGTASSTTYLRGDGTWASVTTSGSVSDASTSVKGIVQLAGDLAGTSASPTVPGLAAKAPIASPTFTGTVAGISKSMVGLGSVDNTADADKPISTLTQTQLNQKAPLARGLPAGGAVGQVLMKTSTSDYALVWVDIEIPNFAVNGTYPTRPPSKLVCWVGPDPGSLSLASDSWREA